MWHRGPDGTRVPANVADMQDAPVYAIGRGKRRSAVRVGHAEPGRVPPGMMDGVELASHFNSVPGNILAFGSQGRDQFLIWHGRAFRIPPGTSGDLSDIMRTIQDRYISLLLPFVGSPRMTIPVIVTKRGAVWDADRLEMMDDELYDELSDSDDADGEGIRAASDEFLRFAGDILDELTRPQPTKTATNARKKAPPSRKARKGNASSKKPNKRGRKG